MTARVQITTAGDGAIVAGRPRVVGEVVVLDARAAEQLVASGDALWMSAQDAPEAA